MDYIVIILGGVFAILNIILFFKVWGMTNDVARLTEYFINSKDISKDTTKHQSIRKKTKVTNGETDLLDGLSIGDMVRCKPIYKELVILSMADGKFECYSPEEAKSYGYYCKEDLILL